MGITITCYDPSTGGFKTIDAQTVGQGGSGVGASTIGPNAFGAKGYSLSVVDVMRTIQEGRAAGIKPFNFFNSASPWESAQ